MAAGYMRPNEFRGRAGQKISEWRDVLRQTEVLSEEHRARRTDLARARVNALDDLAAQLLPSLSSGHYQAVRDATGYLNFLNDDPRTWIDKRRVELTRQIHAIENDEEFLRADELTHPVTGQYTLELEHVTREFEPLAQTIHTYESQHALMALIQSAYDTDSYNVRWWNLQYYRDWKHGDIYTEMFKQERFDDVRQNYFQLRHGLNAYETQRTQLAAKIDRIRGLAGRLDEARHALANLETTTLSECRARLREHLEYIDRADLAERAKDSPDRLSAIKRLHGIEKKIEYLDELSRKHLTTEQQVLTTAIAKLERKSEKYSRPKNAQARIPRDEAEAWLRDPTEKLLPRRHRYTRDYDRIWAFDDYDHYDYARDWLWWDLITDGRIDGDFIPEVQSWRGSHPGEQWSRDEDFHRAGASYTPEPDDTSSFLEVS